ncbi:MAG TPA: dihydroorotate dehydrogenase electron transfer subunit, partial [Firmicutes bacterium]|nr:dihydroorotate dehydrogenase electron transfer subunit [Bacillota bacterium]
QLSLEAYMACGLGACLGCAVPVPGGGYKHVCTDGPVFCAREVEL